MKINIIRPASILAILSVFIFLSVSCSNRLPTSSTEGGLPAGVITPSQIDSSLVDHGVRVQGEVLDLIENPGGHGGVYIKLGDSEGEVGFRIEQADWDAYTAEEKAEYHRGNTVTAEGLLVISGQELVIVFGASSAATTVDQPSAANYVFTVTVPENTVLSDAVGLEIFDENGNFIRRLEMEQVGAYTWHASVQSGAETLGCRYNRDHWDFVAAEEFTPDSEDTLRWAYNLTPGQEINDTVAKWRWCPEPGYEMPAVQTRAATAEIVPRINGEKMQCGFGFVDFWWTPFPELYHGTNLAMREANAGWIKLMPPVFFSQVEPLPVMTWKSSESELNNPGYPAGELENHILQAQEDGLNILLVPQCGSLNAEGQIFDGDKQYSDEWWEAYFDEMMQYGTYFAELAEKCGIKYMAMQDDNTWNFTLAPADIEERYSEYIDNIRSYYSGNLGMVCGLASFREPDNVYFTGYDPGQFDFFAVGGPVTIAGSRSSSVEEMEANFQGMVDGALNTLYETYHKPIIMYSFGIPSCDGGASGDFVFDDDLMQQWSVYNDTYNIDLAEQASAFEAVMRVVARTPYIIGFHTFNTHWPTPFPMSVNFDAWGKPAVDQVLSEWYQRFTAEGK